MQTSPQNPQNIPCLVIFFLFFRLCVHGYSPLGDIEFRIRLQAQTIEKLTAEAWISGIPFH